jgi:hypothetical protein
MAHGWLKTISKALALTFTLAFCLEPSAASGKAKNDGGSLGVIVEKDLFRPSRQKPRPPKPPKAFAAPSRPDIQEVKRGPDAPPLTIDKAPNSERLRLLLNVQSTLLAQAKDMRPAEEAVAVEFVFKYGLALAAMSLIDAAKKTPEWEADEAGCRERIQNTASGIARVIVPLCLSLPSKLPRKRARLAAVA